MNKDYVLFNLREAQDEIQKTIKDLESEPDYEHGDYVIAMSHLYHHINTAWNARDASELAANECSKENFAQWRKMPSDDELMLIV